MENNKTNKKISSVEWLAIELWEEMNMQGDGAIFNKLFEQAKAMHNEEIEKTWIASAEYAILLLKDKTSKSSKEAFEQYYQQTYGND